MGRQDFLLTATEQSLVDVTFQMENYRKSSYWFKKKKKSMNLDLKKEYHKGSVGAPWLLQFSGNLQCLWI